MRILLFIIGLIIISNSALASIGKVSEHKGKAEIDRKDGDKGITIQKDVEVFSYDTVKTGDGRTGITFVDDTKVELTEHSKLVIDEFVYDPNTNTGALSLKASLGSVRYASGQIAKNSKQNEIGYVHTHLTVYVGSYAILPKVTESSSPDGSLHPLFCKTKPLPPPQSLLSTSGQAPSSGHKQYPCVVNPEQAYQQAPY